MFQCEGCGTEIDTEDGVTVIPAKILGNDTPAERQWWHPDCRRAELRKRTGQSPGRRGKRELAAVTSESDDEMGGA